MYSLRKWMFKPKKPDESLLAEFFYTDEELNAVAAELDSFDGRKDPERCTALVNKLRRCQDKVLCVIEKILQYVIPDKRAARDFRVKFPDDILQDNLSGQLWFGAECLAAGSSIMNREVESASMRPLAKALTRQLDTLRSLLRDQCLRNQYSYSDRISEALVLFDKLFAEFELSYVSAMVPVKTMKEYDKLQEVMVLFCETVQRALKLGLLTQEMIDDYDPALMFTIPRLAIVCGLLVYPEGPINPDMDPMNMCEMFRPFQMLLYKIRELLWTLSHTELWLLEKALSSSDDSLLLTDTAFEEQLNRLNWIKLQNPYRTEGSACGTSAGMDLTGGSRATLRDHYDNLDGADSSSSGEAVVHGHGNLDADIRSHGSGDAEVSSHGDRDVDTSSHSDSDADYGKHDDSEVDDLVSADTKISGHCKSTLDSRRDNCMENVNVSSSDPDVDSGDNSEVEIQAGKCSEASGHDSDDSDSCSDVEELMQFLPVDRALSMPHQDSGDSGMISMSDHVSASSAKTAMDSVSHTQRLYWSKSWPSQSSQKAHHTRHRRHSVCCDRSRYVCQVGLAQNSVSTRTTGSREFMFHLPYNTSSNCSLADGVTEGHSDGRKSCDCAVLKNAQEGDVQVGDSQKAVCRENPEDGQKEVDQGVQMSDTHIIYTLNGLEAQLVDSSIPDSSQIAFITGALHDFFFTDPEFQGVTPPRTPSTSSTSSSGQTRSLSARAPNQLAPPSPCPLCNGSSSPRHGGIGRSVDGSRCSHHSKNRKMSSVKPGPDSTRNCPENNTSICSIDCDTESYTNSDTSSYLSDINDDEEIALAIQAAEIAARQEARARFRNSSELIHKLFVCISGVADQLQTNYASDLRHILKAVFECNSSVVEDEGHSVNEKCMQHSDISRPGSGLPDVVDADSDSVHSTTDHDGNYHGTISNQSHMGDSTGQSGFDTTVANADSPPHWVPDDESPCCMSCKVPFTFVRRRHHCRNCGKIFCSRCSSNSVPLPHYGHEKPVRVCNHCFVYQVTPFTVGD